MYLFKISDNKFFYSVHYLIDLVRISLMQGQLLFWFQNQLGFDCFDINQYVILHVLTLGATYKPCQQKISSKWGKWLMLWPWHCNLRQKEGYHRASRLRYSTIAIFFYFPLSHSPGYNLFLDPSFILPLPQILPSTLWAPCPRSKTSSICQHLDLSSSSSSSPQQSRSLKHSKKLDCKHCSFNRYST